MSPSRVDVDDEEILKFRATADRWWDSDGPLAPLHRLNPVRIAFFRDAALEGRLASPGQPLRGLRILDVGCGGGLLAEPLTRLGASVTGIDLVAESLDAARSHAAEQGLEIDYRLMSVTDLAEAGQQFDMVVASEVIEHVEHQDRFTATLAALTAPDGVIGLSTINRTPRAFFETIVGAEYVLGWLPRGTHRWQRFVKPSELATWLRRSGFVVDRLVGVGLDWKDNAFALRQDVTVNYLLSARRG